MNTLDDAIRTAQQNISITQPAVVIESAWQPCIITYARDIYHVYKASAFKPHTGSILPWCAPEGTIIARVNLDLTVDVF